MMDITHYDYNDEDEDLDNPSHQPISSLSSNERSYSASRYQTLRNISSTRRNCKAENIFTKNEEYKILQANNQRIELYHQLSLIRKEKNFINCNNILKKVTHPDKIVKKAKMNNHKYIKKLNQRRLKKKEAQYKENKQIKNLFEDNNDVKPSLLQDYYPFNDLEETTNWHVYYEKRIKSIFKQSNLMAVNHIINAFEPMFHIDIFSSSPTRANCNKELDIIINFNRKEIKTIPIVNLNEHQKVQSAKKSRRILLIKQQKKLLEDIQLKESQLIKCKETAGYYISNLHDYQIALKKKQYHSKIINKIIPSLNEEDKEKQHIPMDLKLKEQLNERVVAYVSKTFEPSLLLKLILYWMNNCKQLKEIRKKNPNYYIKSNKRINDKENEISKKKLTYQVKHLYRKPNADVLFLIPYCTQKYIIVKKDV